MSACSLADSAFAIFALLCSRPALGAGGRPCDLGGRAIRGDAPDRGCLRIQRPMSPVYTPRVAALLQRVRRSGPLESEREPRVGRLLWGVACRASRTPSS